MTIDVTRQSVDVAVTAPAVTVSAARQAVAVAVTAAGLTLSIVTSTARVVVEPQQVAVSVASSAVSVSVSGAPGPTGATGATGPAGVVAATSPLTYNSGTQTVGIDLSGFVLLSGSYSNPSWLTALAWSKLSGTPTTLSGYGITDVLKSGAGVLTLSAASAYTLTIPATGTAALLATANTFTAAQTVQIDDAVTNAGTTLVTLRHNTTGTAANNFGSRLLWQLETSTTADQDAARLDVFWANATHATRTSNASLQLLGAGTGFNLATVVNISPTATTLTAYTTASGSAANVLIIKTQTTATPGANFGTQMTWQAESTTGADRDLASMLATWVVATDASRTARLVLRASDAAANREFLRGEASGSAAMIGFLGASAVARQSVAAAATDLATVITLANDIRTALINLGLAA